MHGCPRFLRTMLQSRQIDAALVLSTLQRDTPFLIEVCGFSTCCSAALFRQTDFFFPFFVRERAREGSSYRYKRDVGCWRRKRGRQRFFSHFRQWIILYFVFLGGHVFKAFFFALFRPLRSQRHDECKRIDGVGNLLKPADGDEHGGNGHDGGVPGEDCFVLATDEACGDAEEEDWVED